MLNSIPRLRKLVSAAAFSLLIVTSCTSEPTAQEICLGAVGELHASAQRTDELLKVGVAQMRDADAITKLQGLSDQYAGLLATLRERAAEIPTEVRDAYELLAAGVELQQEAWISIEEGLRTGDTRDVFQGAELIEEARERIEEFNLVLPDCSDDV